MVQSDVCLPRLLERWPPPSNPHYSGKQIGFDQLERDLGFVLPLPYKLLTHAYGQGVWFQTIFVLNPFFAWLNDLEPWMSVRGYAGGPSWCDQLRTSRKELGHIGFPIYPEPGGLFPWAFLQDGGVLYWLTQGTPESWTILHAGDRFALLQVEISFDFRAEGRRSMLPRFTLRAEIPAVWWNRSRSV